MSGKDVFGDTKTRACQQTDTFSIDVSETLCCAAVPLRTGGDKHILAVAQSPQTLPQHVAQQKQGFFVYDYQIQRTLMSD